jgi:8-oxo-dGTP pyrophosphatase MutT (NUDIX family)
MGDINWKDKCWVTTIFLVNSEKKVLLTWNKNLQTWIPVGGHIDLGETPMDAITREVKEETGIDFEFVHDRESLRDGDVDVMPLYRVHLDYPKHHGTHMNFVFIGKCKDYDKDKMETDEQEKLRWFSEEELIREEMLENVRNSSLEAIKRAG